MELRRIVASQRNITATKDTAKLEKAVRRELRKQNTQGRTAIVKPLVTQYNRKGDLNG